jgi:hypothetical protein
MSKIFETVKIQWDGEDYEVDPNRVMGLINRIEDHISFSDLSSKSLKISKVACAYAEALRYAGCTVTDAEVYNSMFDGASGRQIQNAISGLLLIMIPPEHLQKKTQKPKMKMKAKKKA